MTLTVRLPQTLEQALEQFSASQGLTKSHVVQEALAEYLVRAKRKQKPSEEGTVSETYAELKRAGLIGCAVGSGVSATKDAVRKRVLERLKGRA